MFARRDHSWLFGYDPNALACSIMTSLKDNSTPCGQPLVLWFGVVQMAQTLDGTCIICFTKIGWISNLSFNMRRSTYLINSGFLWWRSSINELERIVSNTLKHFSCLLGIFGHQTISGSCILHHSIKIKKAFIEILHKKPFLYVVMSARMKESLIAVPIFIEGFLIHLLDPYILFSDCWGPKNPRLSLNIFLA